MNITRNNTMKYLLILALTMGTALFAEAQAQEAESGDITFSSSTVCQMCKATIEKDLAYAKGVKSARVDIEENTIHVRYNPAKITAADLKHRINELGYVADDQKPTREQYDRLHHCCRAPGVIDGEEGSEEHFPAKEHDSNKH
jgi:mercuric ion binding protein